MRLKISFLICSIMLLGCLPDDTSNTNTTNSSANTNISTEKVSKSDGSIQCSPGSGTALDVMALELTNAGIDVICSQQGYSGMAFPAVCGAGTGALNIYTIHSANLPDAEALGYVNVQTLPGYIDSPCI